MKGQFEDTKRAGIAQLAVGGYGGDRGVIGAASAHNKLADPARRIGNPRRCLGSKAFINVVVTGQDQISVMIVKLRPEGQ